MLLEFMVEEKSGKREMAYEIKGAVLCGYTGRKEQRPKPRGKLNFSCWSMKTDYMPGLQATTPIGSWKGMTSVNQNRCAPPSFPGTYGITKTSKQPGIKSKSAAGRLKMDKKAFTRSQPSDPFCHLKI